MRVGRELDFWQLWSGKAEHGPSMSHEHLQNLQLGFGSTCSYNKGKQAEALFHNGSLRNRYQKSNSKLLLRHPDYMRSQEPSQDVIPPHTFSLMLASD